MLPCDKAVESAPSDKTKASYLDSRGIARALTGNTRGAIDDFKYYVDNSEDDGESLETRKQWIEMLDKGEDPFTDEVLEELKNQ